MAIVSVMLVSSFFGQMQQSLAEVSSTYDLPIEFILLVLIIMVSPAISNIFSNTRSIAKALTAITMKSSKYMAGSQRHIYYIYANFAHVAALILLVLLIVPFIPENIVISRSGFLIVVAIAITILILIWDMLRKGYDKFHAMITGYDESCELDDKHQEA